ncbi:MAG TPA: glycosyltransferase family 2 protein [Bryobacteraceae bacterium]|nr:glycosyltransferase family 2 protein [Bryobacteraceae bacterium]
MQRVSIVIPNWNGAPRLAALLERLAGQSCAIHEILVVDNGSSDDSAGVAARAGASVLALGANTGFSHAVNCGIRAASGDWICILNNDVSPEPDWLRNLTQAAVAGDAWFATGKLLDAARRDRIDGAFDAICRGACAWRCGHDRPDSPFWNQPREIRFAPFTAALFRADLFQRVGLLDETLESYLEDVDFGIRCAAQGLKGWYVPQAVASHQGSATLGAWHPDTVRKIARNQLLLVAKHYPKKWILRYGWHIFIAQALWGFTALRHGRLSAYLAGKADGLRLFRANRGEACSNFPAILEQSEKEIRELQSLTGFDLYWRLYFALT